MIYAGNLVPWKHIGWISTSLMAHQRPVVLPLKHFSKINLKWFDCKVSTNCNFCWTWTNQSNYWFAEESCYDRKSQKNPRFLLVCFGSLSLSLSLSFSLALSSSPWVKSNLFFSSLPLIIFFHGTLLPKFPSLPSCSVSPPFSLPFHLVSLYEH